MIHHIILSRMVSRLFGRRGWKFQSSAVHALPRGHELPTVLPSILLPSIFLDSCRGPYSELVYRSTTDCRVDLVQYLRNGDGYWATRSSVLLCQEHTSQGTFRLPSNADRTKLLSCYTQGLAMSLLQSSARVLFDARIFFRIPLLQGIA